MNDKIFLGLMAVLFMGFGLAKVLNPQFFLEKHKKNRWFRPLNIYGFLYESKHALKIVRINGCLLLLGAALAMMRIFVNN